MCMCVMCVHVCACAFIRLYRSVVYCRCIKPNQKQKPFMFDSEFVVKQLRYTGMVEAIRVRRQGYSFRPFFSDFIREFRGIAFKYTEEVCLCVCVSACLRVCVSVCLCDCAVEGTTM